MQIRQAMKKMIHDLEEKQLLNRETSRLFHSLRRVVNQQDGAGKSSFDYSDAIWGEALESVQ